MLSRPGLGTAHSSMSGSSGPDRYRAGAAAVSARVADRPECSDPTTALDATTAFDAAAVSAAAAVPAAAAGAALVDGLAALGSSADTLPCRVEDADLWFAETPTELERAKGLCQSCPVRELCYGAAVARREPWGVWGGSIFEQGVVIARKRPRGRPRKDAREIAAA